MNEDKLTGLVHQARRPRCDPHRALVVLGDRLGRLTGAWRTLGAR